MREFISNVNIEGLMIWGNYSLKINMAKGLVLAVDEVYKLWLVSHHEPS